MNEKENLTNTALLEMLGRDLPDFKKVDIWGSYIMPEDAAEAEVPVPAWFQGDFSTSTYFQLSNINMGKKKKLLLSHRNSYLFSLSSLQDMTQGMAKVYSLKKDFFCLAKSSWNVRSLIPSKEKGAKVPLSAMMTEGLESGMSLNSENTLRITNQHIATLDVLDYFMPDSWVANSHHTVYFLDADNPVGKPFYRTFSDALLASYELSSPTRWKIIKIFVSAGALCGVPLGAGQETFQMLSPAAACMMLEENPPLTDYQIPHKYLYREETVYSNKRMGKFLPFFQSWVNRKWKSFLRSRKVAVLEDEKAPCRLFLYNIRTDMAYYDWEPYGFWLSMPDKYDGCLLERMLDDFCIHLMMQEKPVFLNWEWKNIPEFSEK